MAEKTTGERLAVVETLVKEIKDNHLAHLDAKMDKMMWLVLTTLVTAIVSLALKLLQ
jgi:hypothetical protein